MTSAAADVASTPTATIAPRRAAIVRRGLWRGAWRLTVGVVLSIFGLLVFGAYAVAPDAVDRISGNFKVEVERSVAEVLRPGAIPEVTLGVEGGIPELDWCNGEFIEMVSYRMDGVLPLYAAHNDCHGDIILGWEIGQQVKVAGSDVIYEVVEERHTPKWSNVDQLKGMEGELMLQTCYYGENKMRFLSLAPIDPQPPVR